METNKDIMWPQPSQPDELHLINSDNLMNFDTFDDSFIDETRNIFILQLEKEGPPARGDFPGDYQFKVIIKHETNTKKFVYSEKLNKVYINQAVDLPVQFSWDCTNSKKIIQQGFVIRATLQFADRADAEQRPVRCRTHNSPQGNRGVPENMIAHILQSTLNDGEGGVLYCGDINNQRSWLSVCVPSAASLPAGVEFFSHTYKFMCKNSCSSGINRRSIEVTFTLEDFLGEILGRQTVGVRVCSCPRRDKDKDESAHLSQPPLKKRRILTQPSNKVLMKHPAVDLTPFMLQIPLLGQDIYVTLLRCALGLMQTNANRLQHQETHTVQTPFDPCINVISQLLDNISSEADVQQPAIIKHESAHNDGENRIP